MAERTTSADSRPARASGPAREFRFSPRPNRAHEIRWREWSTQAFQEAAREDKPVLLSLSAVWCHWCHVMDETSYSDPEVIRLINESFIPIRVDNDRRPDINARYNMGGWPSTAFLSPEGELLTGATYVPPEQMRQMLAQVVDLYRSQRQEIAEKVRQVQEQRRGGKPLPAGPLTEGIVHDILEQVVRAYDPIHGGFGSAPKFPNTEAVHLLIQAYRLRGDRVLLEMARKTLEAMARGGLFDQEWGGFFRYSTTADWGVPHFEKMLEDNSKLLHLYLLLYRVAGDEGAARVAAGVIDYMNSHLWQEAVPGGHAYRPSTPASAELEKVGAGPYFGGSQDADEAFYALTAAKRQGAPEPYVDKTCYSGWNALAASSYLEAAWVLDRPELREQALRALDFLWERLYAPGRGMARFYDAEPKMWGLLQDQLLVAQAFLDAAQVAGKKAEYINRAEELARFILERFRDSDGAFFDIWREAEGEGYLAYRNKPLAENALAAQLFHRLHLLTRGEEYQQVAEGVLKAFASSYHAFGLMAAAYGLAVAEYLNPWAEINIVGSPDDERVQDLLKGALALPVPYRIAQVLDPACDGARLTELALPSQPSPAAYVCYGTVCLPPVTEAGELRTAVAHLQEASGQRA